MSTTLWLIIACGSVSLAYGLITIRTVLAASPGTERMQEIAGAIQLGAPAPISTASTGPSPSSAS